MKTIKLSAIDNLAAFGQEAATVLSTGGLVCLPCAGRYRIVANLEDADAVMHLMAAKSRVKTAPALVFVDGEALLDRVASKVHPLARKVALALWPRPLTIRVDPSEELPSKVLKQLGGKKARLGVRVPDDAVILAVVRAAKVPLLVSSANREKKHGESSPAQVTRTFGGRVNLFVDGGDLQPGPVSTVIDIIDDAVHIERQGALDAATIEACAGRAE